MFILIHWQKGCDIIKYDQNIIIFKHVFKYIKDSKRYAKVGMPIIRLISSKVRMTINRLI